MQFLRKKQVMKRYGVVGLTIDRWSSDPDNPFPAPVDLGPHTKAWAEEELNAHDERLLAERDKKLEAVTE